MFGGYLLIQAITVISTVKINLKSSKNNISSEENSVLRSALIKIVIDFIQILTLVSQFNFNFPKAVDYLYDSISKIIPSNIDALSVDCFIVLAKGNNKQIFFNKVLVIIAEPFIYMILAYLVWTIIFKIQKKIISGNSEFRSKMYLTIIVIIYLLQPGIIKIMFGLFKYYLISSVLSQFH